MAGVTDPGDAAAPDVGVTMTDPSANVGVRRPETLRRIDQYRVEIVDVGQGRAGGHEVAQTPEEAVGVVVLQCRYYKALVRKSGSTSVCAHCYAALTLLLLGSPGAASRRAAEALKLAEHLAHSLVQPLLISCMVRQFIGDLNAVRQLSQRLVNTASESGFAVFRQSGIVMRGWAIAAQGDFEKGVSEIEAGLRELTEMGAGLRRSYFLWLLADACARADEYQRGLGTVTEALDFARAHGEHFWDAELYRLKGQLVRAQTPSDHGDAERCFNEAIVIARRQNARSLALRASTELARQWRDLGRIDDSRELLTPLVGLFTEGFDTADLSDARLLLNELA